MQTYELSSVSDQVIKIRAEVRTYGEFIAGCEELSVLCPDLYDQEERATALAQIAEWEGWMVERMPDDTVKFISPRL